MKNAILSDATLVRDYMDGNEQALSHLINRHQHRIYSFIYSKVFDKDVTEDVFQDTFIKVINTLKKGKYNEEGKFLPWVMRIAHNLVIDHFRKNKRMPKFENNGDFNIFSVLNDTDLNIEKQLISSASPVGKGGLFFSLLRAGMPVGLGFDITTDAEIRRDAFLFGESMGRLIVGVPQENEDDFVDFMQSTKLPFFTLGHVTKGEIRIDDESLGYIDKMIPNAE